MRWLCAVVTWWWVLLGQWAEGDVAEVELVIGDHAPGPRVPVRIAALVVRPARLALEDAAPPPNTRPSNNNIHHMGSATDLRTSGWFQAMQGKPSWVTLAGPR